MTSPWLILGIGGVYLAIAVELWWHGKLGLAMAFAGYAFSNVGLYIAAR